jgi:hypothetical protein
MQYREDAAADAFGRIFAGIGESERLLGAEPKPGNETADHEQRHVRGQRAEDGEDTEQQQIELIDEAPPEPVAEFALSGGADAHAENRCAADRRGFRGRGEAGLEDVGDQRAEDGKVDDVKEVAGGDQSGEIFASSSAVPTKASIVWAISFPPHPL